MAAVDWANLPPEMVLAIAERLALGDVIRLRAVCGWWAWALGKTCGGRPLPLPPPPGALFHRSPWIILPNAAGEDTNALTFLSLSEDRRHTISPLPQITGRRVMGSSPDGWLVTVDLLLTPRLFNPFTSQELPLPSLLTIPDNIFVPTYSYDGFISKFWYYNEYKPLAIECFRDLLLRKIILPNPSPLKGGIAIAVCAINIANTFLAFASVGDEAWLPGPHLPLCFDYFEDVTYNEGDGKLYAITNRGAIFILERRDHSWEVASLFSWRIEYSITRSYKQRRYIVFSSGDLLQVTRHLHSRHDELNRVYFSIISNAFKIFRFDPHCKHNYIDHKKNKHRCRPEIDAHVCPYDSCWIPVNDLGDRSIFVGSNYSFSLDCGGDHELGLIKRNRVYFSDDMHYDTVRKKSHCDIGVFNLETNIIEHFFPSDCQVKWPPPVLFMSNPILWDSLNTL